MWYTATWDTEAGDHMFNASTDNLAGPGLQKKKKPPPPKKN